MKNRTASDPPPKRSKKKKKKSRRHTHARALKPECTRVPSADDSLRCSKSDSDKNNNAPMRVNMKKSKKAKHKVPPPPPKKSKHKARPPPPPKKQKKRSTPKIKSSKSNPKPKPPLPKPPPIPPAARPLPAKPPPPPLKHRFKPKPFKHKCPPPPKQKVTRKVLPPPPKLPPRTEPQTVKCADKTGSKDAKGHLRQYSVGGHRESIEILKNNGQVGALIKRFARTPGTKSVPKNTTSVRAKLNNTDGKSDKSGKSANKSGKPNNSGKSGNKGNKSVKSDKSGKSVNKSGNKSVKSDTSGISVNKSGNKSVKSDKSGKSVNIFGNKSVKSDKSGKSVNIFGKSVNKSGKSDKSGKVKSEKVVMWSKIKKHVRRISKSMRFPAKAPGLITHRRRLTSPPNKMKMPTGAIAIGGMAAFSKTGAFGARGGKHKKKNGMVSMILQLKQLQAEKKKWDKDAIDTEKLTRRRKLNRFKKRRNRSRARLRILLEEEEDEALQPSATTEDKISSEAHPSTTTPSTRSMPPTPPTRVEDVKHMMDGKAHKIVRSIDTFDEGTWQVTKLEDTIFPDMKHDLFFEPLQEVKYDRNIFSAKKIPSEVKTFLSGIKENIKNFNRLFCNSDSDKDTSSIIPQLSYVANTLYGLISQGLQESSPLYSMLESDEQIGSQVVSLASRVTHYHKIITVMNKVKSYTNLTLDNVDLDRRMANLRQILIRAKQVLETCTPKQDGGWLTLAQEELMENVYETTWNLTELLRRVEQMEKETSTKEMIALVEGVQKGAASDDDSVHTKKRSSCRLLQGSYNLEAKATPLHLPALCLKPHYEYWKANYINALSFQRYLALTPYLNKQYLDLLEQTDSEKFAELKRKGLVKALPIKGRLVKYLTDDEERVPYRVFIKDGVFVNHEGVPSDTKEMYSNYSKRGFGIMVLHRTKGLFLATHRVHEFHHSSFLHGDSVHFAGEMKFEQGRLTIITNKSGHYKPGPKEALAMLQWLDAKGIDLSQIEFRVVRRDGFYKAHSSAKYLRHLTPPVL